MLEKIEKILIAGFGGQGILLLGKALAYTGMLEGNNVTWIPSYGPEMRGGTANCSVIISPQEIGAPVVDIPDVLIAMNRPSLERFEKQVKRDGVIIYNNSLIEITPAREDIKIYPVPATEIAVEIGNTKLANMVMMGAYIGIRKNLSKATLFSSFKKIISERNWKFIPMNEKAVEAGIQRVIN